MRRYWQPVCLSADLKDLPRPVRILGEDLIAFRDGQGRAGLLFFRRSDRGTSLEYGRVEERGLRCCYHGWLYDVEGHHPGNAPGACQTIRSSNKFYTPAIPCANSAVWSLPIWAHLDEQPEFPIYDIWQKEGGILKARNGPRVGGPVICNWLQAEENLMDALHTFWLHTLHSGAQFPSLFTARTPTSLNTKRRRQGMRFVLTRKLPNGKWWELIWEMLMPLNVHLVYTEEPARPGVRAVTYCLPIDDTHQLGASIRWVPENGDDQTSGREQLSPAGRKDRATNTPSAIPTTKKRSKGKAPSRFMGLSTW